MSIEQRSLGTTDMKTPRLVLGGNVFGWTSAGADGEAVLDRFVDAGGTMIDTADVYSAWVPGHQGGESETYIGNWIKRRGGRGDILIATKVGMLPGAAGKGLRPERIAEAVEASLNRLQTDYIDLYYAHQDDQDVPQDEVMDAFAELVRSGKVKALGASNYSADRLASALKVSKEKGLPAFEVLQPELNLIKQDGFPTEMRDLCIDNDIGVLPYFGLASGFLTGKYRSSDDLGKSPRGQRMAGNLTPKNLGILNMMDKIAAETGATLVAIALAWNAAQKGVTAPIASARTASQLDDILGALSLELSADQLTMLNEAAS